MMLPKNEMMTSQTNNLSYHEQTIIAQCTPQGAGAIALMRLSGVDAISIADQMAALPSGKSLSVQKSHTIHFGYVVDQDGKHVDQVLFLLMKGPRTFTGQDVVEITSHNNQFLVESIIDRALECGARLAGNGEFAQRAVINGKIDLVQAEGMNDLIHAQSAESLKYSLQQLEGSMSSWVADIEQAVIKMLAYCEASFEYLDEEMEFTSDIQKQMAVIIKKVSRLLQTFAKQQYIKEGVRIALVGTVNAGKSSLFNCLVNKKRAIVTDIAGTTRDIIESGVYKNGGFITFVDTAGIRQTQDVIEKEGIDRSFQEAQGADLVLLVVDGSKQLVAEQKKEYQQIIDKYGDKVILVQNKIDLDSFAIKSLRIPDGMRVVHVSAQEQVNIEKLCEKIDEKMAALKNVGNISGLLNKRQYSLLSKFLQQLQIVQSMLQGSVDYELVSYKIKESLQLLSEVTGRSVSEAAMDKVFQSFCVGK